MPVEVKEENGRVETIYTPEIMDYNRVEGADYDVPFCLQGDWGNGPHEVHVVKVVKSDIDPDEDMVVFFDGHEETLGMVLECIEKGTACAFEIHGIHP